MSCQPNQYVVTLPSNGAITPLRYRRDSTGTSDPEGTAGSEGKNFIQILVPQTKQNGTSNPSTGTVVLLWKYKEPNVNNVTLANTVQLVEIGFGGYFTIPLDDFKEGWFYACALGGAAIEIHCTETAQ